MGKLSFRKAWLWFGIALCLLSTFAQPTLAAPFQPGNLFVAYGGSNIGVFNMDGTLAQPPLSTSPSSFGTGTTLTGGGGIALDEFGNLYVTVSNDGTGKLGIMKFNANGTPATGFPKGYSISGVDDFRGLAVRGEKIYVATNKGIRVFNTDGTRLSSEDFGGTLAFRDVAFDKNGNLYGLRSPVSGTVEVRKWTAGNFTGEGTILFSGTDNPDPRALVLDMDGNLYITVNSSPPTVRKFSQSGTLLATYLSPTGTGTLIGLDFDPGTNKFFAIHTQTGGIGQWLTFNLTDPSGTTMTAFGPNNLNGVRWATAYPTPEPSAVVLLGGGLLLLWRRRRKKTSRHGDKVQDPPMPLALADG